MYTQIGVWFVFPVAIPHLAHPPFLLLPGFGRRDRLRGHSLRGQPHACASCCYVYVLLLYGFVLFMLCVVVCIVMLCRFVLFVLAIRLRKRGARAA